MNAKGIFTMSFGLILGLFLIVQILTGGWNSISNFYKYGMVGVLLVSFFNPKFGFYFLILASGYMDLFKRVLVVGGHVSFLDLIYIVGLPSLTCFALFAGCAVQFLFNPEKRRGDVIRFGVAIILTGLVLGATVATKGLGLAGLKQGAFAAGFAPLVFVVPFLFRDTQSLRKILILVVATFVPVALYTFWQVYNGLSDFEIAYLETGLSNEIRMLRGQDFRYFSTLNSSQNLAKIMGMFGAIALLPLFRAKPGMKTWKLLWSLLLGTMFFYAAYLSGARTGIIMGLTLLVTYFILRSKILTVASYITGIAAFFLVVFSAEYVVENDVLDDIQSFLYSITGISAAENRIFVLGTLTVRFESLAEVANGNRMFPFGAVAAGQSELLYSYEVHEILSGLLVQVGYVPLLIIAIPAAYGLFRFHKTLLNLPKKSLVLNLLALGFANFASVAFGSFSAGGNFQTFPVSYFIYFFFGISWAYYAIWVRDQRLVEEEEIEDERKVDNAPSGIPVSA